MMNKFTFTDIIGKIFAHNGKFALMFHAVYRQKYTHLPESIQPYLSSEEFSSILEWLRSRFSILSPRDFLDSDKSGVLLTFDDGYANNSASVLPVLERYEAPAIFFVTTQHIVDSKNWLPATKRIARTYWQDFDAIPKDLAFDLFDGLGEDELRRCAGHPLVTIGSHTVSHPLLSKCTTEQVFFELENSRKYLSDLCGEEITLLAYPTGDYDRKVAQIARQVGYRASFAVNCINVGIPEYEIPRIGIFRSDPTYLSLKLSGVYRRPYDRIGLSS